jgi:pyruvate dehydrogenase E1 component
MKALLSDLDRDAGLVTVADDAPLALSWLGSVLGQRARALRL